MGARVEKYQLDAAVIMYQRGFTIRDAAAAASISYTRLYLELKQRGTLRPSRHDFSVDVLKKTYEEILSRRMDEALEAERMGGETGKLDDVNLSDDDDAECEDGAGT